MKCGHEGGGIAARACGRDGLLGAGEPFGERARVDPLDGAESEKPGAFLPYA